MLVPFDTKEVTVLFIAGIGLGFFFLLLVLMENFRNFIFSRIRKMFTCHYPQKKDAEQNKEIYTEMVELRAMLNADRVWVARFHNGTEFLPVSSAWKMSCSHEIVRHGVTYTSTDMQGLIASRINPLVDAVITGNITEVGFSICPCRTCPYKLKCSKENKRLVMLQTDEMLGSYLKFRLDQNNVKSMICIGLVNNGNVFGILGVDFCASKIADPDFKDHIAELACRSAERIRYLLLFKKTLQNDGGRGIQSSLAKMVKRDDQSGFSS